MNIQDQISNAQRLATDVEYRKTFITGLHEYQKANMHQFGRKGYKHWGCGYDHYNEPADKIYHHFIMFCERQRIDWKTAHSIFREKYGEIYCDCDYLYNVTDEGVEVVKEPQFLYFISR